MRRRLVLTIAAFQIALGGVAAAETLPCKQDPRIIQQCFAVHGRLSVHANMRPYLWPIGTNRLLGVASPDGAIIMPPELERLFAARIDRAGLRSFRGLPLYPAPARDHANGVHRGDDEPHRSRRVLLASVSAAHGDTI
jgi:hypothetical protein